ncbi:unnamed protein product [Polarella glacialis]|uniref:Uncharacterized protein n=1 Tax=Polarella glacialis TaxID=89957 RepID=A0A813LRG7_POLGL|nr:unnamed protein product [Polarella glacialis]
MLCMVGTAAATMAASLRLGQVVLHLFNKVTSNNNDDHITSAASHPWGQALSAAMASTLVFLSLFLAASLDAWCALLLLTPAALDLLLLLLQTPKGLLGSPQRSAEVATSRNADIEEYHREYTLMQQRDGFHHLQALEFKNFTWPGGGTRSLDEKTSGF